VFFLDVFPLQHAEGRAEDNDRILQKQFDLLASLLTDSDHNVRAHAALGVCHILKEYWESLPVNTTHNILKYLIDTLSCDASCANVRHAVFVGLNELFQQPLAHAVLKQLLPLLQNSIHDKSEKVRVAFIRILCQVRIPLLLLVHTLKHAYFLVNLWLQCRAFIACNAAVRAFASVYPSYYLTHYTYFRSSQSAGCTSTRSCRSTICWRDWRRTAAAPQSVAPSRSCC
jgi:hypothetical protein